MPKLPIVKKYSEYKNPGLNIRSPINIIYTCPHTSCVLRSSSQSVAGYTAVLQNLRRASGFPQVIIIRGICMTVYDRFSNPCAGRRKKLDHHQRELPKVTFWLWGLLLIKGNFC